MTAGAQVASQFAERPALRGVLHLIAAVLAAAGSAWLLLLADSPSGYVGGAVFAASLILLYGTSASYHRILWRASWRRIVRRVDHAMIFALIAGTYTPFCLDVHLAWGIPLLAVVWSLAGAGMLLKIGSWPSRHAWTAKKPSAWPKSWAPTPTMCSATTTGSPQAWRGGDPTTA